MATGIGISCPTCGRRLRITEEAIGRTVRCGSCQNRFTASSISFGANAEPSLDAVITQTGESSDTAGGPARSGEVMLGTVGRFVLRAALGQGAFGRVYRAHDPLLDRQVALKVPTFSSDQTRQVERFLREAKSAARLRHPNIVAVFESGRAGDNYFIASEFVDGKPLSELIQKDKASHKQAVKWVRDLAGALAYAHSEGVVHRDIKPANIMLSRSGRVQLMDFGLAKLTDEDASLSVDGQVLGTPAYMPPEQARGDLENVGPASDQYSLGVVLYELLTGQRPFRGPAHSVIRQVLTDEPPPPRSVEPSISPDLAAVCQKTMEKEAGSRYHDLESFAGDLDAWLTGRPVTARRITVVGRLVRWCRRDPLTAALAGAVAVSLFLGATISTSFALIASAEAAAAKSARDRVAASLSLAKAEKLAADEARDSADQAKRNAVEAKDAAETARVQAEQNRVQAELHRVQADLRSAQLMFDRSMSTIEQGDLTAGLFLLNGTLAALEELSRTTETRAAEFEAARILERSVRLLLAGRAQYLHPLETVVRFSAVKTERSAFQPNAANQRFAAISEDGSVAVYDTPTGRKISPDIRRATPAEVVSLSQRGDFVAIGGNDGTVQLHRVSDGSTYGESLALDGLIRAITFSPDNRLLAVAVKKGLRDYATGDSAHVRFWDVEKGVFVGEDLDWPSDILTVCFSPDAKLLATGGVNDLATQHTAQIWELKTRRPVGSGLLHSDYAVVKSCFSPDGERLATAATRGTVCLWQSATGQLIHKTISHGTRVVTMAFAPNGRLLLTGGLDGTVKLWDVDRGVQVGTTLHHSDSVWSADFDPTSSRVYAVERTALRTWAVNPAQPTAKHLVGHQGPLTSTAFSRDGRFLVTGSIDHTTRVWTAAGKPVGAPVDIGTIVFSVAISGDGRTVAAGSGLGGAIRILQTGRNPEEVIQLTHRVGQVRALALNFTGNRLISGGIRNSDAHLWDVPQKKLFLPPIPCGADIATADFSHDDKFFATGTYKRTAQIWDSESGRPVGLPITFPHGIKSIRFSSDGQRLLVGVQDGTASVFDVMTGNRIGKPFLHRSAVLSADWLSDEIIVTGCEDGSVSLWDFASGRRVQEPLAHPITPGVGCVGVACHPSERVFATAFGDNDARLWGIIDSSDSPSTEITRWLEASMSCAIKEDGVIRALDLDEATHALETVVAGGPSKAWKDWVARQKENATLE